MDFNGVKVALYIGDKLLIIERDDIPTINYPGMWDLVGGGREGDETPIQCAQREIKEELNLDLKEDDFVHQRVYPSADFPGKIAVFLVAKIASEIESEIVFGDEGQGWKLVTEEQFFAIDKIVPFLPPRLSDYLNDVK
ncbi:MAG TPA: NUDIX hydrolase [Candidatus Paceibacterota bacterium]|nr:NUDIX hydrolase [Candidatus Paceibacterota bacterium]